MGTSGPIRLAKEQLMDNNEEGLFFVFNSDIICQFNLEPLLKFHKTHGKQASIMTSMAEDPSKYGVLLQKPDG